MARRTLIVLALFILTPAWPEVEPPNPETTDERQLTSPESEMDIIPEGGITVSTQPLTPISRLPEKKPYDQALEDLAVAQDLLKKGRVQAASDVSLQAYDDLTSTHVPRRNKKQRKKLLAERHQAATLYIDSSLAFIQHYVKRAGGTPQAMEEGKARIGDLHDVAVNYSELNKKLTKALEQFRVEPSTPAAAIPVSSSATVSGPILSSPTAHAH